MRGFLLGVLLAALVAGGLSGAYFLGKGDTASKDQSSDESGGTPKSEAVAGIPDGWSPFETSILQGAVKDEWVVGNANIGEIVGPNELTQVPPAVREAFKANEDLYNDTTIIWLDFDPEYATNIQLTNCLGKSEEMKGALSSESKAVQLYRAIGLSVESLGEITTLNRDSYLLKVKDTVGSFDAYQVPLLGKDCYSVATLFTRPGDMNPLDSFKEFLKYLDSK